ncbi:hypothetical protein [Exiguobacterium aestuarii]|uniref:hypothetical protein n=1 Tax=Exiguobacterium aestuarii TaxID=273527 RepID=UPI001CD744CF|nr:hypothetical protein [Exiguobacterium aestuarii]MCA0980257.1 hypothetical protein [Exiguobacterium aestuarii]
MNIVVIGGTQVAIKGTTKEIEDLLRRLQAVTVEQTGSVTKYVTQDKRIRVAK